MFLKYNNSKVVELCLVFTRLRFASDTFFLSYNFVDTCFLSFLVKLFYINRVQEPNENRSEEKRN